MSEIGELYDSIIAGDMDKVASDVEFDGDFWEKVASGDEASNAELGAFIDEARESGYDDEQIAAALDDAMSDGAEIGGDLEDAKHAAWNDGFEQAIAESLELAKQAGVEVDVDDLVEYDVGGAYGQGFAEGRQYVDEAIEKIAEAKEAGVRTKMLGRIGRQAKKDVGGAAKYLYSGGKGKRGKGGIRGAAVGYARAMGGGKGASGWRQRLLGKPGQAGKVWGARVGTAAGLGGGAALVANRRKK
jgi:hypothetical protein